MLGRIGPPRLQARWAGKQAAEGVRNLRKPTASPHPEEPGRPTVLDSRPDPAAAFQPPICGAMPARHPKP